VLRRCIGDRADPSSTGTGPRAASLSPPDLVQPHRLFEALGYELPAVSEEEAFAAAELADGVGDEDFGALRLSRDARGENNGLAKEVAVFLDGFAGVQADADRDGFRRGGIPIEVKEAMKPSPMVLTSEPP